MKALEKGSTRPDELGYGFFQYTLIFAVFCVVGFFIWILYSSHTRPARQAEMRAGYAEARRVDDERFKAAH